MNLEIYLSNRCNFACPYCCVTVNQAPPARLDAKKILKAVDDFLVMPQPASVPERQVYFLGGEPMIDFPLIRTAVAHLRAKDRGVGVRVYTNGSLLNPANASWLLAQGVQIWISLDGVGESNDKHRVLHKSGDSAWEAAAERFAGLDLSRLAVNMVVHPDTTDTLVSSLKTYQRLGFGRVNVQPELYAQWTPAQLRGLNLAMSRLRTYYASFVRRERRLPFVIPTLFTALQDFAEVGESVTPWWEDCQNVVLGADGRYYACERVLMQDYADLDAFAVGDAEKGLDHARKDALISEARAELYARGEKKREHYHCPKGDYLYAKMTGEAVSPMLDNAHKVSRAFARGFLALARELRRNPVFREVYIEKRQGGLADAGRPERLIYSS